MSKPSTHRSNAQQQRQRLGWVVIAESAQSDWAYAFSNRAVRIEYVTA